VVAEPSGAVNRLSQVDCLELNHEVATDEEIESIVRRESVCFKERWDRKLALERDANELQRPRRRLLVR